MAEVGVLAETAKYPSVLARSARLQIFATEKHRILQWQIFATKTMPALALAAPHKHYESCASIDSPVIALAALR